MLYGMGEPFQRALIRRGIRVRVYTPYGALLPGMAYLVRRLLENTSNESFLKASFTRTRAAVDDLLRNPEETGKMWGRRPKVEPMPEPGTLPPFANEPLMDFSRPENRDAMVGTRSSPTSESRLRPNLRRPGSAAAPATFGNRPDAVRDASTDPCDHARVVSSPLDPARWLS